MMAPKTTDRDPTAARALPALHHHFLSRENQLAISAGSKRSYSLLTTR